MNSDLPISRLLRAVFVLAGLCWAAGVLAADPDISGLRKPGTYVILLDGEGKAITGAYWLSPDIKAVIHSEGAAVGFEPIFVDREIFPRYIAVMSYFLNERLGYIPDPMTLDVGKTGDIVETTVPMVRGQPGTIRQRTVHYGADGKVASTLQNVKLINHLYSIDGDRLAIPGRVAGKRVYIETLDLDLSAAGAARAESIEIGEAASSGDFQALYAVKALPLLPDVVKCIEKARATPEFQAAARKQHDTADAWMATKFAAEGFAWWDRQDVKPEDFEPDIARICG